MPEFLNIAAWSWEAQACFRIVLAAVLGASIGLEREHHGRAAGFRTQLLVAMGAALAMVVSLNFAHVYGHPGTPDAIRVDPARVAYGVMGGIGFLGAGAIVRFGINIRGMTTAASLWCTAALGLACGFGMYAVSVMATVLALVTLLGLSHLDRYIPTHWYRSITVTLRKSEKDNIARLGQSLRDRKIRIIDLEYALDIPEGTETLTFHVQSTARKRPDPVNWFADEEDVLKVNIR